MDILIFAIFVGLGITYFATQNTAKVSLQLASYMLSGIPLYLVVVGALLLGLALAWIFSLASSLSSTLTIRGGRNKLKQANKTIAELAKKNHQLELESARLKTKRGENDDGRSL